MCYAVLSCFSHVRLFATLQALACQSLLSMGNVQTEILQWVAVPPLQGIFLTEGSNSHLLHLLHWQMGSSPLAPPGKPLLIFVVIKYMLRKMRFGFLCLGIIHCKHLSGYLWYYNEIFTFKMGSVKFLPKLRKKHSGISVPNMDNWFFLHFM